MRAFSSAWSRSRTSNASSGRLRSRAIAPPCVADEAVLGLERDEVLADRDRRDAEPGGQIGDPGAAVLLDDAGRSVPVARGRRRRSGRRSQWRSRLSCSNAGGGSGHVAVSFGFRGTVGTYRNAMSRKQLKPIEICGRLATQTDPGDGVRTPASSGAHSLASGARVGPAASCGGYDRADEASDDSRARWATEADVTTNQAVVAALRSQRIELPSWAFGNSGTRFKVFAQQGVPRDPYEKIADAAQVHRYTGVAPTVALHIPWDKVDDYADLARHAADQGVAPRDDQLEHLPGRRLHARERLPPRRARPPQGDRPPARLHRHHGRDRVARPQAVVRGRDELPRPGRHPGAPGPPRRGARRGPRPARAGPADGPRVQVLRAVVLHDGRPRLGDRRTSSASPPGPKAMVVVDTGHHAPGTNIEFIVAVAAPAGGSAGSTSTRASTPTTT